MIIRRYKVGDVTVATIDPKNLKRRRENFRAMTTQERDALKASIRKYGFKSMILTRAVGDNDLEILDGHHRTEIAAELGIPEIPAVVLEEGQDATSVDLAMLAFNVHANPVADHLLSFLKEVADSGASAEDIASLTAMDTGFVDSLLFTSMATPTPADPVAPAEAASATPSAPTVAPAGPPAEKSVLEFFKKRYGTKSREDTLTAAAAELYDKLILD